MANTKRGATKVAKTNNGGIIDKVKNFVNGKAKRNELQVSRKLVIVLERDGKDTIKIAAVGEFPNGEQYVKGYKVSPVSADKVCEKFNDLRFGFYKSKKDHIENVVEEQPKAKSQKEISTKKCSTKPTQPKAEDNSIENRVKALETIVSKHEQALNKVLEAMALMNGQPKVEEEQPKVVEKPKVEAKTETKKTKKSSSKSKKTTTTTVSKPTTEVVEKPTKEVEKPKVEESSDLVISKKLQKCKKGGSNRTLFEVCVSLSQHFKKSVGEIVDFVNKQTNSQLNLLNKFGTEFNSLIAKEVKLAIEKGTL